MAEEESDEAEGKRGKWAWVPGAGVGLRFYFVQEWVPCFIFFDWIAVVFRHLSLYSAEGWKAAVCAYEWRG